MDIIATLADIVGVEVGFMRLLVDSIILWLVIAVFYVWLNDSH